MTAGRVLVFDAERRQALVAIRNLGRHGIDVTAASTQRTSAGALSKYADRRVHHPDPERRTRGFLDAIDHELDSREYDMLLPMADPTVIPIVEHRERFESRAAIPFLPYEKLQVGLDKKRTIEAARDAGVPHPKTLAPTELDIETVKAELEFPVVMKPRWGAGRLGVSVCDSPEALEAAYDRTRERRGPVLIQEYIPFGGERGVYTLYDWDAELAGVTVQQRLRTNPPEGGTSTLRETVADPELVSVADDFLSSLGWQGAAMVEFRIDSRDGEAKLMEINPRLWGSLALSVFAGVEFPYLLYQLSVDGTCERSLDYDVGVQARRLLGDVVHVLGREDRAAAVREFLRPADVPRCYDVLSTDDPVAAAGYVFRELSKAVGRRTPLQPRTHDSDGLVPASDGNRRVESDGGRR